MQKPTVVFPRRSVWCRSVNSTGCTLFTCFTRYQDCRTNCVVFRRALLILVHTFLAEPHNRPWHVAMAMQHACKRTKSNPNGLLRSVPFLFTTPTRRDAQTAVAESFSVVAKLRSCSANTSSVSVETCVSVAWPEVRCQQQSKHWDGHFAINRRRMPADHQPPGAQINLDMHFRKHACHHTVQANACDSGGARWQISTCLCDIVTSLHFATALPMARPLSRCALPLASLSANNGLYILCRWARVAPMF